MTGSGSCDSWPLTCGMFHPDSSDWMSVSDFAITLTGHYTNPCSPQLCLCLHTDELRLSTRIPAQWLKGCEHRLLNKVPLVSLLGWRVKRSRSQILIRVVLWKIKQEDITLISIYAPNIGAPKYVKQIFTEIKVEINRNIVREGYFNTIGINGYITQTEKSIRKQQS